jgi:DNA invertase Pin-like site-specific DNA recombinase
MRAAVYARVSTVDQEPENQLRELRRYVGARGWTAVEYVDHGISGAKDRRPALDQLLADASVGASMSCCAGGSIGSGAICGI